MKKIQITAEDALKLMYQCGFEAGLKQATTVAERCKTEYGIDIITEECIKGSQETIDLIVNHFEVTE